VASVFSDSFRPPLVNLGSDIVGQAWFATMELTVYFFNVPEKGWLPINFFCDFILFIFVFDFF